MTNAQPAVAIEPGASAGGGYTRPQLAGIFTSALLGYGLDGYNLLIVSFVLTGIESHLHISAAAGGFIVSMQLVGSIVGGVVLGAYADRFGRRKGLAVSIVLYSLGALLSAFSWNYGSLLAFRLITAVGLGGEFGLGMSLFNEAWAGRKRGLGAGIIQSSFVAGIAVAGWVAPAVMSHFGANGWRVALMTGFIPVVLGVIVRLWMPESKAWQEHRAARAARRPADRERAARTVRTPVPQMTRRILASFFLVGGFLFSFYSLTTFMPSIIGKDFQAGTAVASNVNTVVTWTAVGAYILVGWLSDIFGRKRTFLVPAAMMVAGSVLIYLATGSGSHYPGSFWGWDLFWGYYIWYVGTAAGAYIGAWLSETFPVGIRATSVSSTYMFGRGASGLAPIFGPGLISLGLFAGPLAIGHSIGILAIIGVAIMVVAGIAMPKPILVDAPVSARSAAPVGAGETASGR
ncbi:MAG TPA: MFS transporter [Trebonia sp.]|nr:MFS transporter [Trebonia sp.]